MSFESPTLERKEVTQKTLRDMRRVVERMGGLWQVDGIEVAGDTIFAFYVSPENAAEIEMELLQLGYESEEDLDDPYVFPDTGKYRKIFMPAQAGNQASQSDSYFFRVAEKK